MGKKTKALSILMSALVACSAFTFSASALNGKVSDDTLDKWSGSLLSNEQNFLIRYLEDQPGWEKGYDIIEQAAWLYNPTSKMIFSYESERSLEARATFINENDLGGCIAWDAQGDRIETFPMFNTMKTQLKDQGKDVVSYYGNWMAWGESDVTHTQGQHVEDLPWEQSTCINYSFFGVSDGTIDDKHNSIAIDKYKIVTLNERLDFGTKGDADAVKAAKYGGKIESWSYDLLDKMGEQKALYPDVDIMLSIGGWSHSNLFHELSSTQANRKVFIDSCVEFLKDYPHFDGIDIDWEYPSVAGTIPYGPEDKENLVSLVKELREALEREFPNQEKRISVCAAATPVKHIGFDAAQIAKYVDRINVMSYNYNGDWSSVFKGYISPLFKDDTSEYCTENIVKHLLSQGVDPGKINVGSPLYGFSYQNVNADSDGNPACLKNPMVESMRSNDMTIDAGKTKEADASYVFTNNSTRKVSSLRNDVTATSSNEKIVTTNVDKKTGEVTVKGVAGGTAQVTVASPQDLISTTFTVTVAGETGTGGDQTKPDETVTPSTLPTNCSIGYWENWSGVNKMALREINPNWDVVIASFMLTDSTHVKATFTPDNVVYPGGDAQFIEDVKFCQARGQKVLVSLGGGAGEFQLTNESEMKIFYDSACEILEKYGFDGIDIDLEGSTVTVQKGDTLTDTVTPVHTYLNIALHDMAEKFGSDFILTMAPEHPYVQGGTVYWGSSTGVSGFYGGYLPLINNCRDILTFIHPQYYNNPITQYNGQWWACPDWDIEGYNVDSLVKLSEVLITGFETRAGFFEGLRPDQVAFGVPTYVEADGRGYLPFDDYAEALDRLIKQYPTFRGIMAWSINKPDTNTDFANKIQAVIDENTVTEPTEPLAISSLKSSIPTGVVEAGTEVSWTVNVAGGTQPYTYQYEVMFNNQVVDTVAYSTNATFTQTLTDAGKHKVKITVKDADGTTVVRTSGVFTVEETVVIPPVSNTEFAMKLNSTYAYKNGTVEKTSGSNNDGQGVYYAQLRFEGSSLVLPLRYVAESAGLEVGYDIVTGLTTITDGETTVKIIQDSSNIIVVKGGVESTVDIGTPAKPFRQVLHIPVRGVLNQFDDLTIKYDYMTGFVTVTDYDPDDTQFATLISKVQTALADL